MGPFPSSSATVPHEAGVVLKLLYLSLVAVVLFTAAVCPAEVVITIDSTNLLQEMDGFGASLTDSSASLLWSSLSAAARSNIMAELFSTNGIGISLLRQPMGASDFRLSNYTYNDRPAGQTDYGLTNFSVAHDETYIIPLLQQAMGINTNLKIMATPWTAPAWMKTTTNLFTGRLKNEAHDVYAKYFMKFVQAYSYYNLPIYAVTLGNEPLYQPSTYPGMLLDATNEIRLAQLVAQHFQTSGITTKIICYDHNWDQYTYPITVLDNAGAHAVVEGSAFHGYGGDVSAQSIVHQAHPDKGIYFTEVSSGDWSASFSNSLLWDVETLLVGAPQNWAKTVIKWNIALDQNHGPKITGGCTDCRGLITVNSTNGAITRNPDYYAMAHISKFVRPGARRVASTEAPAEGPYSVTFANPDTSTVVIAFNDQHTPRNYAIHWKSQSFNYLIPQRSVATFVWPDQSNANVEVWLTTGDKTKLLQKQTNGVFRFQPQVLAWKGRTWNVRDTDGNPGNSFWSADCVRIDTNDWLRIQTRNIGGTWYCGGVDSADSPSFGTYRWYTVGYLDQLDTNVVGNLSTYFDASHELDVQFAMGLDEPPTNVFYTVQPYYIDGHQYLKALAFTNLYTTHEFTWNPRTVQYRSWYGHSAQPTNAGAVIAEWTYEGDDVPNDTNEHVRMNLWMLDGIAPAISQELVIANFAYACSTGTLFYDDFENGSIDSFWQTYSSGGGTLSESSGKLRCEPAATDNAFAGARLTNTLSWSENGLSYIFSANLSTIVVTSAKTGGGPAVWAYEGLLSDTATDPFNATNAATLRAGYDSSANVLTIEFLTKTGQTGTWGTARFAGTIANASSFLNNGTGLELRLSLVYYDYKITAFYQGSPVLITPVSGSATGTHNLGSALFNCRYGAGAAQNGDGRGYALWEKAHVHADAELGSTAGNGGSSGGDTLVQIGNASAGSTWREPISTKYNKERSEVLYRASQIPQAGTITQLELNILGPPPITLTSYKIRMQHTVSNNLSASFINTGWTTVYNANTTIPTNHRGWYAFSLSTPFHYNATNNLLVEFIVDNTTRSDTPRAAASYTAGSGIQGTYAADNSGDPTTWTSTSGKRYRWTGDRYADVRLAISNDLPPAVAENLSFEDGPLGALTNVPGWQVEGDVNSGLIKGSPVLHLHQSLKLWKSTTGDQKLYQFFNCNKTNQYTIGGYILSPSMEPFRGSNAYGAILVQWYGTNGLLQTDESDPFTAEDMYDMWLYREVTAVPPINMTSGRIVCALFTSDDQSGVLYFDHLSINYGAAPPSAYVAPIERSLFLVDEFNDTTRSNIWSLTGDIGAAQFQEGGGTLRINAGTNWSFQQSGYITTSNLTWNNTSTWYVFSAVLSTIRLDTAQSGNDLRIQLALSSERDNAWYVTNSASLCGYYDSGVDQIVLQFLTKTDAPQTEGTERYNATVTNFSRFINNGTNHIRISIALGLDQYDLRFSDAAGLPIPVTVNAGSTRGPHALGTKLCRAYWMVGAQNDGFNRGSVFWDRTEVYDTVAPNSALVSARQTSTDGSGIVTLTNTFYDINGTYGRLLIQASTNAGTTWFSPKITSVTSSYPTVLSSTPDRMTALSIATTNTTGLVASNIIAFTWDTKDAGNGADLTNRRLTNCLIRIMPDDYDVGGPTVTSTPFTIDNEAPSALAASVIAAAGASYVIGDAISATWSGFADDAGLGGYYSGWQDGGGSTAGTWFVDTYGTFSGATPDAINTIYLWAADVYGNIGGSVSDQVIVLSLEGDFDGDGLVNTNEEPYGASPVNSDSDGDGQPDGWEVTWSMSPTNGNDAGVDTDADGYSNLSEFIMDTCPTSALSSQQLAASPTVDEIAGCRIIWNSSTTCVYSLYGKDEISLPWQPVAGWTNLAGTGANMVYTGAEHSVTTRFYRIGVARP